MAEQTKPLILHVDDDEANRYAVTRSLVKAGFEVVESATGHDALLKAEQQPDLMILDVRLPDIDGFEVCRRLRASRATARIPILHLSASYTTGQAKAQGLDGGADAYLVRPVEPVELIATINALLRARRSEEALRRSEERYRRLIDEVKDYAIFLLDLQGNIASWNSGAERILGYSESEVLGRPVAILFTPEDCSAGIPAQEMAAATEHGRSSGLRWHLRRGGERLFADEVMTAVRDDNGRMIGFSKLVRDVTLQQASGQALKDARRRLDSALLAGEVGTWVYDVATQTTSGDSNLAVLFNVPLPPGSSEVTLPLELYLDRIHPHDRTAVSTQIAQCLASGTVFTSEYRLVSQGRVRWMVARGTVERDGHGNPLQMAGVVLDITERRAAEAGLNTIVSQRNALLDLQRTVTAVTSGNGSDADHVAAAVLSVAADSVLAALPQAQGAAIEMLDTATDGVETLVYQAVSGSLKSFLGLRLLRQGSLSGRCIEEGRPLVTDDCETDPRVDREACRRTGVRSMVVVPIPRGGVLVGVLKLASAVPHAFAEADVLTVQLAVGSIATGLSGAAEARAVEALRRSEAEFRQLADAMPQIVWAARPDGFVDYYNSRWYEYTGLPPGQTGDAGWDSILPPDEFAPVIETWTRSLRTGQAYEIEYRFRRASDGMYRWHLGRALPVRDVQGTIVRWFGTNTDIHDVKQLQADRERLLVAEQSARAEAERQGRTKDDFLATLSHELRTPLNSIVGWVEILRSAGARPSAEDLSEGLAVIDRNARAQTQIIEDILDMSRIISGKLRLDVQRVDLATLVRAGVSTVQPAADAKGVRLQILLDPTAGPVSGDPDRLHQIFWNLLSNAVKFTPRLGRVQVLLERVNSHVEVSVTDTGEGIDPAFLPFVFDRFRQADASTTRKHGGLGLGLAIVKQLVELHGGSVRAQSAGAGRGATFTVVLPVVVLHPDPADAATVREHPTTEVPTRERQLACGQLNGLSVLVVDDEPDGRAVVKRLLEECGAIVRTAGSAAEAVQLLAEQPPAVLVSDIGMPGEDGYALIRRVRSLPAHQGGTLPAVALTAYARASDRVRALEAGFQAHLAKPVEPAELIVTVAAVAKTVLSPTA